MASSIGLVQPHRVPSSVPGRLLVVIDLTLSPQLAPVESGRDLKRKIDNYQDKKSS
jgi:hypothetical protein